MPIPLSIFNPDTEQTFVRAEIVNSGGTLECEFVYSDGSRCGAFDAYSDESEEAWWLVALSNEPKAIRRQAINALLDLAHESHRYDCAD